MEAKVVLAKMFQSFSFRSASKEWQFPEEYYATPVIKPKSDIGCYVTKRSY